MFLTFMLVKIQSFSSSIGAYHCVLGRISAKIGGKLEVKKPKIVNLSRTKGFLHSFNTFSALCFYKCSGFITIIVLDEEHVNPKKMKYVLMATKRAFAIKCSIYL